MVEERLTPVIRVSCVQEAISSNSIHVHRRYYPRECRSLHQGRSYGYRSQGELVDKKAVKEKKFHIITENTRVFLNGNTLSARGIGQTSLSSTGFARVCAP